MLDIYLKAACKQLSKTLNEISEEKVFKKQIFFGAGNKNPSLDFTEQQCSVLRHKIEKAFTIISGMQQNGLQGHKFDEQSDQDGEHKLYSIVEDIVMGLTGININLEESVVYGKEKKT